MTTLAANRQKHMTQEDRVAIEAGLSECRSMREIASMIGKDPSTISKEIKKHRTFPPRNTFNDSANQCANIKGCKHTDLCNTASYACAGRLCRTCSMCNIHCPDFVRKDYHCEKLDRAPFVCNGCKKRGGCRKQKSYYRAVSAQLEYRDTLVRTREGINISAEDLKTLDDIVSPLIRQGQSPYRKILPDGSSFDGLTQKEISLVMSHVNSSARESLGGRTPFDLAHLMLPGELLDLFALSEIAPDDVDLTPGLLK